jgi:hypothetical protein
VHPFEWALGKPFLAAGVAFLAELAVRLLPVPPRPRVALVVLAGLLVYPTALMLLRPGEEERRFVLGLLDHVLRRKRSEPTP